MNLTPQSVQSTWAFYCPRIYLHCEVDDGARWFDCATKQIGCNQAKWEFIHYTCRDCRRWKKVYSVFLTGPTEKEPQTVVATKMHVSLTA